MFRVSHPWASAKQPQNALCITPPPHLTSSQLWYLNDDEMAQKMLTDLDTIKADGKGTLEEWQKYFNEIGDLIGPALDMLEGSHRPSIW